MVSTRNSAIRYETVRAKMTAMLFVAACAWFALGAKDAHAAPAAGTVIGNQATATYNDAGGVSRSATSNLVQTTVSQVKSFTVAASGAKSASPGQTVYYPHVITNTGNGTDTYALNPPTASGGFTHTGLVYYADANGDGIPDNFTPITTSGPLASGGQFSFVVAGTVPAATPIGTTGSITVSVSDTTPTTNTTNVDVTTVADCALNVTKAMNVVSGPSPNTNGGAHITVTLSYTNSGTAACTTVVLRDQIPTGMTYVAGSGVWSGSGTALTDAAGGDPAGIAYDFGVTPGRVTATITTIGSGTSGFLRFAVDVNAGLAPTVPANQALTTNTGTYNVNAGPFNNTNSVLYTVLQTAAVVADDNPLQAGDTVLNDVVEVPSASPGSIVWFRNNIHNNGNGTDSFDIALTGQASWPAGTTFALFQADQATSLIDTNGNGTPDTGPVAPGGAVAVYVKVTLPAVAPNAVYSLVKTATSFFNPAVSDTVTDRLLAVAPNTVDLTNNTARADSTPAGTAVAGNATTQPGATGFGATGSTVITTNTVTPSDSATTITRFRLYVNNTGGIADSYNLSVAGTPAGWSVAFRADASAGACTTVGAASANTGTINAGANKVICAEVTIPLTTSGNAAPGTFNLDFTVASATNPATVTDVKRDAVTVLPFHRVTLTPNNAQQTFPGGTVTYIHTISNTGNVSEVVSYATACLTDSRSAQGWTSAAYLDNNGNGTLEIGTDPLITCGTTTDTLAPGQTKTVFVRAFAPGSATSADPANVTTLTATYNGATTTTATDSTTVTDGVLLSKDQRTINCDGTSPSAYTQAAIPAGPLTAPNRCIGYRVTATNTTATTVTLVVINDLVPANTKMEYLCGAPAVAPGAIAGSTPPTGATGTVTANVGTLTSLQSAVLTFCVRIDP